jgi:ureidoacrylate peracid hydrolase
MLKTLAQKIDPRHAAVLVVDMQNDFCDDAGFIGKTGRDMSFKKEMAPRLARLVDEARLHRVPVIFIRHVNNDYVVSEASLERKLRQFGNTADLICSEGSWGADFYVVQPRSGDPVVTKHRYSAFVDTNLDLILRSTGIKTLIMTGVATNMCVESTARDGFMKDYYIVFVSDCTATSTVEDQEATLRNIRYGFGVVHTSEELIRTWEKRS